jgi:hypothetical protein
MAREPHAPPWVSPLSRWRVHRVMPRRVQPDVVPFALGAHAGWNSIGVEVLKGPQRPLVWALEHQRRAWREPVQARSTATGGAQHGWGCA